MKISVYVVWSCHELYFFFLFKCVLKCIYRRLFFWFSTENWYELFDIFETILRCVLHHERSWWYRPYMWTENTTSVTASHDHACDVLHNLVRKAGRELNQLLKLCQGLVSGFRQYLVFWYSYQQSKIIFFKKESWLCSNFRLSIFLIQQFFWNGLTISCALLQTTAQVYNEPISKKVFSLHLNCQA